MTIAKNAGDPGQGSVTLNGTRYPGVDDVPFAVKFDGSMISGSIGPSRGGACDAKHKLQFKYDPKAPTGAGGYIHVAETKCAGAGVGSCRGELFIAFSPDTVAR